MLTDIEIAQSAKLKPILDVAKSVGLSEDDIEYYGKYKAKIGLPVMERAGKDGKLILVTAITPTPAGEGKTTTTIGLADGMRRIGKKVVVALREPSLGPVFGVKGGAAGGGYSQVLDINLHFTGDAHAVGAANNLLAAMLDNHIFQGNALGIDKDRITWKRCVDMNDRQLRYLEDGLGGGKNGVPRKDGFEITVASEVMAILCLATSLSDLKARLERIVVGYTYEGKPVTAGDLKAAGAMCALLKDALKPNLVQRPPSCTAGRSPISRTAAIRSSRRARRCGWAITSSRKRDSAPISVRKNFSTSSAALQGSSLRRASWWRPSVRSKCTAALQRRTFRRKICPHSKRGCPTFCAMCAT